MTGQVMSTLSKMVNEEPSAKWMSIKTRSGMVFSSNHATLSSMDSSVATISIVGLTSPSNFLSVVAAMISSSIISAFIVLIV